MNNLPAREKINTNTSTPSNAGGLLFMDTSKSRTRMEIA
jgi:hypothetical protein